MDTRKIENYKLPFWWMMATEVFLFIAFCYFTYDGKYIEAILLFILIELRDLNNRMKSNQ